MSPWVTLPNKDYKHATKEITNQRDRGAGLIATAMLQDHLLAAIQARLESHQNVSKNMFKSDGPLGSFSAQIDLGLLLGLYTESTHKELHVIRAIRNDFAHNVQPVSFRARRELCAKLNPPKGFFRTVKREDKAGPFSVREFYRSSSNPRTQFIAAVKRHTMALTLATIIAESASEWVKTAKKAPQPKDSPLALRQKP